MSDKGGASAPDLWKWLIFIVILAVLIPVYFLLINPGNEDEARQMTAEAESRYRQAQALVQKNKTQLNLADLQLAEESLGKARSFLVESDYQACIDEARSVLLYTQKILQRQNKGNEFQGPIRFEEIVGEITVRKKFNAAFASADISTSLDRGDTIKTLEGSCRILFQGKMEAILRPSTEFQVPDLQIDGDDPISELLLESGEVRLKTLEPEKKPEIITGAARIVIFNNSEAWAHFTPSSGRLDLRVRQGRVELRGNNGATVNVLKDQQMIVTASGTWGNPVDLPAPPEPRSPENFAQFTANSNGFAPVNLVWDAAPAGTYYLEVSSDSLFRAIVQDRRTLRENLNFSDLRQGAYFWRVSSINDRDVRGVPSAERQFEIKGTQVAQAGQMIDNKPPPLSVNKVTIQGYIVILMGKTEPGAKVTVDGQPAIMDEHTGEWTCTIQEPGRGTYSVNIIATDRAGNRTTVEKRVEIKD